MTDTVHIMTLSPELQLTLKLIFGNQLKVQIKTITDYIGLNIRYQSNPITFTEKRGTAIIRAVDIYDILTTDLPGPNTLKDTKTQFYTFNHLTLNRIIQAIDTFKELERVNMDEDEIGFVNQHIGELESLTKRSLKFEYTLKDIDSARKQMK